MPSAVTHAVIGTAGHIDHGKTALIKALTGQDTDRLKEEKERGISIDLGFAYLTLPDGTRAGIIDVPGHERFIRNMLAGAHGIDLVLFTVAADDGVMPQSEEHLDILHLLGTRRGLFLITKADVAAPARIAEVRDEIDLLKEGTALEQSPVMAISSITGQGLEQLRNEIVRQLDGFEARRPTGIFRMPLDRAFVIKGHGTVATGTAMGAMVSVGQKLRVMPGAHEVRVRSIQVHGEPVERAGLSQRVALNLVGEEKLELRRGQVLADDRLEITTDRFDSMLEIRPAAKRALKNNQRIRVFVGTCESLARAIVLDERGVIEPKSRALAQVVLDEAVVALASDRFIVRDETNVRTLGGGVVLNPLGRRNHKPLDQYRQWLTTLHRGTDAEGIEALLNLQETFALTSGRISQLLNLPVAEVESAMRDARFVKVSLGDEEGYTTHSKWDQTKQFVLKAIADHHKKAQLSPGLEMEALRSALPYEVAPRAFRSVLDKLARETGIVREESLLRLKSHRVTMDASEEKLAAQVEAALNAAQFQPPELKQLAESLRLPESAIAKLRTVLGVLEREGRVVKVATDLYFARAALEAARSGLADYLRGHPEITAAAYRDLLGTSRKFSIALLDHFDRTGVTIRIGDLRRLREKQS